MRAIRFALEYAKAELLLRDWGIRSTIIVFGSARIPRRSRPKRRWRPRPPMRSGPDAQRMLQRSAHYEAAREFGRIVSERGGAFAPQHRWRDNVIATGGGPGIMEAANRGAFDAGAPASASTSRCPRSSSPIPISPRS